MINPHKTNSMTL